MTRNRKQSSSSYAYPGLASIPGLHSFAMELDPGSRLSSSSSSAAKSHQQSHPSASIRPQIWLISDAFSALGRELAHEVLSKGHLVALGCRSEAVAQVTATFVPVYSEDRVLVCKLDPRNKPLCQSALAEILAKWTRLDVVIVCPAKTVVATIEEASEWHLRDQLEASYYGPVNLITTVLPVLRQQKSGHILAVTGIVGQMGTPSLGLVSAAVHALEGYTEALAFEIAPFNIKLTIVEPSLEIALATPVFFTKAMDHYKNSVSAKVRSMLACKDLSPDLLVKDVVTAIINVAGIENPPARLVAGAEAIEQIRDKLRTVSEEIEDMLEVSYAADSAALTEEQRRELRGVD
ncbi:hypothetical protein BZA70DRAFT_3294 [Myxozyma melibiosi]|uniref:Uncharacterized protein n=1 Tax=Myxozyma melibiosi TaxID=54550 RepID=A0ABR1FB43_9ASCO